uniref:phosphoinositide 5-phosphatase n=1 Tax=Syphacia muris TaxID=451379 RepID=A0A0N5A7W6_9BILA
MASRAFRVLFRDDPSLPFSVIVDSSRTNQSLLLESSAILTLINNAPTEEYKKAYKKLIDCYGLLGILRVSKEDQFLLAVTGVLSMGQLYNCDIYKITMVQFISLKCAYSEFIDPRINELQRLMSSGIFYFATSVDQSSLIDLTLTAQKRMAGDASDDRFFWNKNLHYQFERYGIDTDNWLLRIMCGTIQIRLVYIGCKTAKVAVLSRLSSERVGTRFNVRGVNDRGHVANFVETEQLIIYEGNETSFVQIRGSVPLSWEQPGINVGSHKVKLRALEISFPAYERHFRSLKKEYGGITIVDLLGSKEGERILTQAYKTQHQNSSHKDVEFIAFDYHAQMKTSKKSISFLMDKLKPKLKQFGFFHVDNERLLRSQCGVLRTNCLDCLDRTNAVQTCVGLQVSHCIDNILLINRFFFVLGAQLRCLPPEVLKPNIIARFEELLKDLWQKNGDFCSVIYAGTGALEGKSKFKDAGRSLARTIQNNLMDASKQESFDLLLYDGLSTSALPSECAARFLPPILIHEIPHAVERVLERESEMVDKISLTVFAGTWNVNGGKNMHNIAFRNQAPLSEWLFPKDLLVAVNEPNFNADIVAIGLEELIDLNASNIVKASTTNQKLWCKGLMDALSKRGEYVLLGCEQLVGVCLFIFIKPHLLPAVRDFATSSVKTGMGGTAGNKGSVSFCFSLYSTSFCFVCSHFAAGQNEVRDRYEDYVSTLKKIHFSMGRHILSNDVVIWVGDFNYRISLPGDEVKKAIQNKMFGHLAGSDQLTRQKAQGLVFKDFYEGPLNFAPTYKYDTFSDDYDTSEKCRVPAWTDRIFYKFSSRSGMQLLRYGRSELKTSDHRPVGALFNVTCWKLNVSKYEYVYNDIISSMGPPDATVLVSVFSTSPFPAKLYYPVLEKLTLLGIAPLLSKFEEEYLWLVLENGEMALAALSMDGLSIDGFVLNVRLRIPDWTSLDCLQIKTHLANKIEDIHDVPYSPTNGRLNFEFEDDDDDASVSNSSTSPSGQLDPELDSSTSLRDSNGCADGVTLKNASEQPATYLQKNIQGLSLSSPPSDPCVPILSQTPVSVPLRAASSTGLCTTALTCAQSGNDFEILGGNSRSLHPEAIPTIPPRPKVIFR